MQDLIGKIVVVLTTETTYTGKLIEIGEKDVYIEAESGWLVIPVENVVSIVEKED